MVTKQMVLDRLRGDTAYERVADELALPPGQLFMIATGLPADGGDALAPEDFERPGMLPGSSQHLVNPGHENPTKKDHVLHWVKVRAGADPQMQHAAAARDAEPAEPVDQDDTELSTVLGRDHNQVKALLEQLSTIPGVKKGGDAVHRSRRASIVDMVTVRLSKHEAVEERVLWPEVRELLPDGDDLAATGLEQEQKGKETLTALGETSADDERFDDLVEELVLRARQHVAFEDRLLLELGPLLDEKRSSRLGRKVRSAEKRAPTRPHRHAPKRPPGVQLAGAAGAVGDAVRDHLGDRPAERKGKGEQETGESTP
jgi:hypothetical protein